MLNSFKRSSYMIAALRF